MRHHIAPLLRDQLSALDLEAERGLSAWYGAGGARAVPNGG